MFFLDIRNGYNSTQTKLIYKYMTLYDVSDHKELAQFFENYEHIAIAPMTCKVGQKTWLY